MTDQPKPRDFDAALSSVRENPSDERAWDALEQLGIDLQKQEDVARAYRAALTESRAPALAALLGPRARQWHEEWLADDAGSLPELLDLVLDIDPGQSWAFERLTVLYTSAGRWSDLLGVYDRAIGHARAKEEKLALITEARNIARDVGDEGATLRYMREALRLSPADAELAASLERHLEKLGRHEDLVSLWRERASSLSGEARAAMDLRLADTLLEKLSRADEALRAAQSALATGARAAEVLAVFERIAAAQVAPAEVRREALETLAARYRALGRDADVVRTLEASLALGGGGGSAALHRETATRLGQQGDGEGALKHWLSVLEFEPTAEDALDAVRALAGKLSAWDALLGALDAAAAAETSPRASQTLLLEAADVAELRLRDAAGALSRVELAVERVHEDRAVMLRAHRRLAAMHERAGDLKAELSALARVSELEDEPAERRAVAGKAARLAERLGEHDQALAIWNQRLRADASDSEAQDARVDLLARLGRAEALAEALTERATLLGTQGRARADWVRAARVIADDMGDLARAIGMWRFVGETFGEDAEVVDALSGLLRRAEKHDELAELLLRTADREANHVARVLGEAGDVQRELLGRVDDALASYEKALTFFPEHEEARRVVTSLLEDAAHQEAALRILSDTFARTGEWRAALGLVDARVRAEKVPAERAEILRQAARTAELRGSDTRAAFAYIARALPEAPTDTSLEADLLRLAHATGDHRGAKAALEAALARLEADGGAGARVSALRLTVAELQADHLAEPDAASEVFLAALRATPERADLLARAATTALAAGRLSEAVLAHLLTAKRRGVYDRAEIAKLTPARGGAAAVADALLAGLEAEGLSGALAHQVALHAAVLLTDAGAPTPRVLDALRTALDADPLSREALERAVGAASRTPSAELVAWLERLAALEGRRLDLLAAAVDAAERAELGQETVERLLAALYERAGQLVRGGAPAEGALAAEAGLGRALKGLAAARVAAGDHAGLARLAMDAASFPLAADERATWLGRAGEAFLEAGDRDAAASAFRTMLERTPGHAGALAALARLAEEDGRLTEMLALRRKELESTPSLERRLALRLEIVRLVGEIERREGRVEALFKNLDERPGHLPSIEALIQILESQGRFEELADVLEREARHVETAGDAVAAARLWQRAAALAEGKLGHPDRAVLAYRRVVELHATPEALDALARLRAERGDHASAAQWLERRLLVAEPAERTNIALRLARAHLSAGQREQALRGLEAAFRENPASEELRDTLRDAYRADGRQESLAWLLAEAAPHAADAGARVEFAREAAQLYRTLGKVERARAALELAAALAPEDKDLRLLLADAHRADGAYDKARVVLRAIIEEFGRRRSVERAQVHLLLAQVEHAAGDLTAALEQLDLAAAMDAGNAFIARTLGDVAFEAGDHARAERAYRALLLVLRRHSPPDDPKAVGLAEVHEGLSRVARARGDAEQAADQRAQALAAAELSDVETERLVRTLERAGDVAGALDVLSRRLPKTEKRARTLATMGRILSNDDARGEEALGYLLDALDADASDDAVHRQARLLAVQLDASDQYAGALRKAAGKLKAAEPKQASELLLRLVRVLEEDLQDVPSAIEVCREVEALGQHRAEAWVALARLGKSGGDARVEEEALERIVLANEPSIAPAMKTDAMFGLAAIRIESVSQQDAGVEILSRALDAEPRYTLAGGILRKARAASPSASLLSLYGRVARSSTDTTVLLDYLDLRARREGASLDEVREAAELARSQGDRARVVQLLDRAMDLARGREGALASNLWIARDLGRERLLAGDAAGAVAVIREGADAASGPEALELWLEAARMAAEGGAPEAAREIYDRLFVEQPTERGVWEPYLALLRTSGDEERFNDVIGEVLGSIADAASRSAVRIERARYLMSLEGREADAAEVLREALRDEPTNAEAARLLTELFERTGYSEELEALLTEQLGHARTERDLDRIKELSLKLGTVLARVRREDAMEVFRHALTWLPDDHDLASALLGLFAEGHDPAEWAETLERLLRTAQGDEAANLSLELAARYGALGDEEAVARVLELGYGAAPGVHAIRQQLEAFYQERQDWSALAGYMVREARRSADAATGVALFRNAAALYLDHLEDPRTAAAALKEARELAPGDAELLAELVSAYVSEGALVEADEEVSGAMAQPNLDDRARASLLRARGGVRLAMGRDADAVSDLEQAYALGGAAFGAELAEALRVSAEHAAERGDEAERRMRVLRQVQVLSELGRGAEARALLVAWVEAQAADAEAIALLCDIDEAAERWDDLVDSTRRLAAVTEGDSRAAAVVRHADACARAGRPGDAREVLERMVREEPARAEFRASLVKLYEELGAHAELAVLLMEDALSAPSDETRHALLRRAGYLFIQGENPDAALAPLEEAVRLKPTDHETVLLLVDGLIAAERYADAGSILERAIEAHPKRRSPELAELQSRMATLAAKADDPNLEMQWLSAAMESDKTNGAIVARLAYLAMELKEFDVAENALRVVTLSKTEGPMSRAMAFLLQGRIAHHKGEQRRAILWARKAKSEDPNLREADEFLAELGA